MTGERETEAKKWWSSQHPIGRIGTADEIAAMVVWLSSPQASFITGTDIAVDGGYLAR
ncbi:MAG: SDR family oxidoreductase [Limisphaerales bacterium]